MAIFGKSRRFRNPDGSAAPGTVVPAFRMLVLDSLAGRGRGVPGKASVPCVAPDLAAIATPPGVGEGARLTWIGHASWLLQLEGKSFLIDPVFGELALGPGGGMFRLACNPRTCRPSTQC